MTYAQFARKLGVSESTLYRLENGEQSASLQLLQQIVDRLKSRLADVFKDEHVD